MRAQLLLAVAVAAAACAVASAADARAGTDAAAWKSQIVYFLLTDRFAPPPGAPAPPCKLTDWSGGTWSGITHNLDYIQDMGMTAIWITPIPQQWNGTSFGETGYHGYWAVDWTRLEPRYGSERDLKDLIKAAHDRGMLMMLDVVANHVGPVESAIDGVVPFNQSAHYHDCAGCTEHCSIPQSAYVAADAFPTPKDGDAGLVQTCRLINLLDLNQSQPFVRAQLLDWVSGTLEAYPFDGIRIDTVKHVDNDFWADYTAAAKVFSLGEVLNGNARVLAEYVQPMPGGGRKPMDSVLNFALYYKLNDAFAHQQDMRALAAERRLQHEVFGPEQLALLGNFIDNHDVPRFLTLQPDVALFKNALAWLLLADGIPIIYYGSAAQLTGAVDGGHNRACLWENSYRKEGELYRLIGTLAKLRTERQTWNHTERQETVTADCYAFTPAPGVLVVTTNRGSAAANDSKVCTISLPHTSRLLHAGLGSLQDVLDFNQSEGVPPKGVEWNAAARELRVSTPGGAPRVLTASRLEPSNIVHTSSELRAESGKEEDDIKIPWGKAPGGDASGAAAATAGGWLAAAAVAVAAAWL